MQNYPCRNLNGNYWYNSIFVIDIYNENSFLQLISFYDNCTSPVFSKLQSSKTPKVFTKYFLQLMHLFAQVFITFSICFFRNQSVYSILIKWIIFDDDFLFWPSHIHYHLKFDKISSYFLTCKFYFYSSY